MRVIYRGDSIDVVDSIFSVAHFCTFTVALCKKCIDRLCINAVDSIECANKYHKPKCGRCNEESDYLIELNEADLDEPKSLDEIE